jgi:iron complex outermembrane receptor protein
MNYLVDENDQVIYPPEDWGSYTIWNGSVQYYLGENLEHKFQLRFVNIFDETAYERQSSADQRHSTAAVRREIGQYDAEYYYYYHWNTKPRSVWLQYSYNF